MSGILSSPSLIFKSFDKLLPNNISNNISSKNYIIKNPSPSMTPTSGNKFEALVNPSKLDFLVLDVDPSPKTNSYVANTIKDQPNLMHGNNSHSSPVTNLITTTNTPKTVSNDSLISPAYISPSTNIINPCMSNKIQEHLSHDFPTAPQMAETIKHVPGTKSNQNPIKPIGSSNSQSMQIEGISSDPPRTLDNIVTPSEDYPNSLNINHHSTSKYA